MRQRSFAGHLAGLVACGLAGAASAQCTGTWNLLLGSIPQARQNHALAYDAARGKVVLFGGFDSQHFELLADTWILTGINWTQTAIGAAAPSARSGHAMVYDSQRQRTILFAGSDGNRKNDTWEWNGTTWSQVSATGAPPIRQNHAMAYDSIRQRVVVFGGLDVNAAPLGDTWEYNPATSAWLEFTPAASPSGRYDSAMAFDSARGLCILFGGQADLGLNNNTWEWDGAGWNPIIGGVSPGARSGHAMVYDASRHVCVLFGGATAASFNADTWERSATAWTQITNAGYPSARYFHAMAFDSSRGATILYAGSNGNGPLPDTWERACPCYPNCDASTVAPILNVGDFICFLNNFAAATPYANCDGSTTPPVLNVLDFTCFLNRFAAGCS